MKKVGFYAGSFSPFTRGHLGIVCEALNDYDKVIIGVGVNKNKPAVFPVEVCCEMILRSIDDLIIECNYRKLSGAKFSKSEINAVERLQKDREIIEIVGYSDLTVDCALRRGATALIRGERIIGDHDAEMQTAMLNKQLLKIRKAHLGLSTIPVLNEKLTYISSSNARNLCGLGEFIAAKKFLTPGVHAKVMEKYLRDSFFDLIQSDYVSDKMAEKFWEEYVEAYSDNRSYHNLSHIAYCLNYLNIADNLYGYHPENRRCFELAVMYHDFVHKSRPDDEKESCFEIRSYCLDPETYKPAEKLIMATCHSQSLRAAGRDEQLIHDLDLAVLGDEDNYGSYAVNIRREYPALDNVAYGQGRKEVLKKLLKQPQIYMLEYFRENFEETARWNLKNELAFWEDQGRL